MKPLLLLLSVFLLSSCSVVPGYKLVERQGITYKVNSTKPFTGSFVKDYDTTVGYLTEVRGKYKDGKPEGLWKSFYWFRVPGGGSRRYLGKRENYKDGKLEGLVEEFYENGQLLGRGNAKDGELEGLVEEFYKNGQLEQRGNAKDGKEDGLWEWFDKDGNLTKTETWKDGELVEIVEQ